MADIFISYARQDKERVRPLAKRLEAGAGTVWWDRDLLPGQDFSRRIQEELDRAACVIVVWSKSSIASPYVQDEANEGRRRSCLVPVLFDEVVPPLGFRALQTSELFGWPQVADPEAMRSLIAGVRLHVPSKFREERTRTEAPEPKPLGSQLRPRRLPDIAWRLLREWRVPASIFIFGLVAATFALGFLTAPDSLENSPTAPPIQAPSSPPSNSLTDANNTAQGAGAHQQPSARVTLANPTVSAGAEPSGVKKPSSVRQRVDSYLESVGRSVLDENAEKAMWESIRSLRWAEPFLFYADLVKNKQVSGVFRTEAEGLAQKYLARGAGAKSVCDDPMVAGQSFSKMLESGQVALVVWVADPDGRFVRDIDVFVDGSGVVTPFAVAPVHRILHRAPGDCSTQVAYGYELLPDVSALTPAYRSRQAGARREFRPARQGQLNVVVIKVSESEGWVFLTCDETSCNPIKS